MYHLISDMVDFCEKKACHSIFKGHKLLFSDDEGLKNLRKKIFIKTNNKKNNFGIVVSQLPNIFPKLYTWLESETDKILTNDNRQPLFVWYIDGHECFTNKKLLPNFSSFAISEFEEETSKLWISKPSHPYVGSGKLIKIGTKESLKSRGVEILGKNTIDTWVLQPLRENLLFWDGKKKFDIRFHVLIYSNKGKINCLINKYGYGRKCVNIYDPINDVSSAITNISFQEKIPGYDVKVSAPIIYDDIGMVKEIMEDLFKNIKGKLSLDKKKDYQLLPLGLDVMISDKGKPILIEINEDPYLSVDEQNNIGIVMSATILGLFGYLIPSLSHGKDIKITDIPDWEQIGLDL